MQCSSLCATGNVAVAKAFPRTSQLSFRSTMRGQSLASLPNSRPLTISPKRMIVANAKLLPGDKLPADYTAIDPYSQGPPRRCGILLHPTSLPGDHGIGDFGPSAFKFLDWLHSTGSTAWQVQCNRAEGITNLPKNEETIYQSCFIIDADRRAFQSCGVCCRGNNGNDKKECVFVCLV